MTKVKFLNPIMAGDHPDPSILKDGDRRTGADVAAPIRKPAGPAVPHGQALSDDFAMEVSGYTTMWHTTS